ncbi:riboflavin kinase [Agromyces kandeliae]|nr:riboflavin kinase [Agromyces kandeliae]
MDERERGFGGRVVHGHGRGRILGFPTANLAVEPGEPVPEDGVYACRLWIGTEPEQLGATISIGDNPTFGDVHDRRVEVYVHDLDRDLYGSDIRLEVAVRLRGMVRFTSLEELIRQTESDVVASRAVLAAQARHPLPWHPSGLEDGGAPRRTRS